MERQDTIIVDNVSVNPRTIQNAYDNAKYQNKTFDVLSEVFRLLNLSKIYEVNPSDRNTKEMMKNIVNSQFIPQQTDNDLTKYQLDLSEAFPLNKLGNFGRQLERKCRLTEKGLMQFEEGKPPKSKDIKSFQNRIQFFGDKNNDNKIGWIGEEKKYMCRIIVIDKSDGHKGIYFTNPEKAEQVRVFLSQSLRYKGNFPQLIANLNKHYLDESIEAFKNKLIFRKKMISKSNRFSRNLEADDKNRINDSRLRGLNEPQNTSVFFNDVLNNSNNRGISEPRQNENQMLKIPGFLESKARGNERMDGISLRPPKLKQLQAAYITDLYDTWLEKAKRWKENLKRQSVKPQPNTLNSNTNNNFLKPNNQSDRKSNFGGTVMRDSRKKQDSIFRGIEASSIGMKQSYVKQFSKQVGSAENLSCFTIQFLTLNNLFFKPIVTVELIRKGRTEQSLIYNTVIIKKDPHLSYQLLSNEQQSFALNSNIRDYEINIKIIDFLANEQVLNDRITMQTKKVTERTVLTSNNKTIRLQMGIMTNQLAQPEPKPAENKEGAVELNVPPLGEDIKQRIHSFWQKQSQSQGYYNQSNLTIYKILSQIQSPPLTWWKGVKEDDFELYQVVNNASKILGFKMIRSFPHILKVFEKIYPDLEEMAVKLLSFILTFLKPYYFPQYLNKIQKFHRAIGLEEDCEFISKVNLQIIAIQKIVQFECPTLHDKLTRRNITYGYKVMEYIYEVFSRNYSVNCLIQIWNHLYQQLDLIQLNMVLGSIALIKYYEQDLMKAKRLKDFSLIMESQKIMKSQHIIKQIINLKQKYFAEVKGGFLDEIKNIFNSKPLEPILFEFYKKQTAKIDKRKTSKQLEKKSVLRKVNKQIQVDIPTYDCKRYCLHIYFRKLPNVSGSLTIRTHDVDYECLNHDKNRYFIIGEVYNRVTLIFLDLKSNEYTCELQFNQGINEFTVSLTCPRTTTVHRVTYIAGLLTDNQIDIFRRGKKFDHFLSPFVRQYEFFEEMNRPIQETDFLKRYDNNNSRDDLVKKIKVLFCSGTRSFNEVEFYIEQIETSDLSIEEKVHLVKTLAGQMCNQFSLCSNKIYEKHFFKIFLEKSGFQFNDNQYECFYSDSLENQFASPKLIKCRYVPLNQQSKELKLENEALSYFISKGTTFLYNDIPIDEFIHTLKTNIIEQLGAFIEGELKLLYSSNGEIYFKCWLMRIKNKNKDIQYEQIKEDTIDDIEEIEMGEPEVLMTEVLPSFAKISTILDYVNTNRNIDLKAKYQDKDRKKLVEAINILKECQSKFSKVITMRHQVYPEHIYIPFFDYYYELVKEQGLPNMKIIYFNSLKSDLRSICVFKGNLKFGENAKVQAYTYRNDIGLYGNLRLLSRDSKAWFFFGYGNEQHEKQHEQARVFANYGYGVFRWQPCYVLGFINRVKSRGNTKSGSKQYSQPKKEYLIVVKNKEKYVKEYELQLKPGALSRIQEIFENGPKMSRLDRSYFDDDQIFLFRLAVLLTSRLCVSA